MYIKGGKGGGGTDGKTKKKAAFKRKNLNDKLHKDVSQSPGEKKKGKKGRL